MASDYQTPSNHPIYGNLKQSSKNHLNGLDIMREIMLVEIMEYGHQT